MNGRMHTATACHFTWLADASLARIGAFYPKVGHWQGQLAFRVRDKSRKVMSGSSSSGSSQQPCTAAEQQTAEQTKKVHGEEAGPRPLPLPAPCLPFPQSRIDGCPAASAFTFTLPIQRASALCPQLMCAAGVAKETKDSISWQMLRPWSLNSVAKKCRAGNKFARMSVR